MDAAAAEAYEKDLMPRVTEPWAARLVKLADPQRGEHVLDVACGTGIAARLAATSVTASGRLVGLDSDAAMVEVARRVAPSLEWHCASALDMPFEDATFDLSLCVLGLMFFPDCAAGLAEVRRVLKPSARFVASVRAPLEFNKGEHALITALEHHDADTSAARKAYSLADSERLSAAARRAGFGKANVHTEDGLSHFPSVQAFFDTMFTGSFVFRDEFTLLSDDGRSELLEEVNAILEPYAGDGGVALPTRMHILFARP